VVKNRIVDPSGLQVDSISSCPRAKSRRRRFIRHVGNITPF